MKYILLSLFVIFLSGYSMVIKAQETINLKLNLDVKKNMSIKPNALSVVSFELLR